ncbi:unnamed protein product, partial [marine sediment metagenome]
IKMWTKTGFGIGLVLAMCALVVLAMSAVGGQSSPSGSVASAASGDFENLDFVAAQHTTYYHSSGSEGNEVGVAEGQDLGYDDGTTGVDVKEELEAVDWECDDRIVFFTRVAVHADATGTKTIFIVYHFDAHNGGQQGVGYEYVVDAGISAVNFPPPSQTGDDGNVGLDGNETVTKISEGYLPSGSTFGDPTPADRADVLEVVVKVTGLDPGDELIVRTDVRFSCFDFPVTGTLHAAIDDALFDADNDGAYPDADDDRINVGHQDVP